MSTATKLEYLNETKSLLKDSINSLGGEITSQTTFRNYATELNSIYASLPKVSGSGSNISLSPTLKGRLGSVLKGNIKQTILPNGYTQVDYIQSSGTQYIDTNYQITSTTSIETKIYNGEYATQTFGVEANNIGFIQTIAYFRFFSTGGIRNPNYLNQNIEIKTVGDKVYLKNGTLLVDCQATPVNIPDYNLYLFARNSSGTITYGTGAKIYYFKIYDNNIIVRNFIPCYRNSDNEVGMYDVINNVFYTNQGTGSFTYGTVVYNGGTPTPDVPLDIQSVTGTQKVKVEGKNLLNISSNYQVTGGPIYFDLENPIPAGTYIISITGFETTGTTEGLIHFLDSNNSQMAYAGLNNTTKTKAITVSNPITRLRLYSQKSAGASSGITSTFVNLMISINGGDYEPYQSQTKELNLGNIKLNKIGNYQDYITGTPNNWSIVYKIGNKTLNGQETYSTNSSWNYTNTSGFIYNLNNTNTNILSNRFTYSASAYSSDTNGIMGIVWSNQLLFRVSNTIASTTDGFKTWLSNNNVEVDYVLATETTEPITNQEIINQLNEIYNLQSYNGTTNITITSEDLELIMTASALKGEA